MASKTDICNLGLNHLGVGKEIANVDTEASEEAIACRRVYPIALGKILRDYDWPFATKIAALGLVTDSEDEAHPYEEWDCAYQYPSDCLKFRRILSGTRRDSRATRVPHRIVNGSSVMLILTDSAEAYGEYTVNVSDTEMYPNDFIVGLSLLVASMIAPRVTGGDPFKLGERAAEMYKSAIGAAKSNAADEEQPDLEPDSEFISTRT